MNEPRTLLGVLRAAAEQAPDRPIIHVRRDGSELRGSHVDLLAASERVAGGLRAAGIAPRETVLIALDRSDAFQAAFWGALIAGAIPVPLAAEQERFRAVWSFLDRPPLLVEPAVRDRLPVWLDARAEAIRTLATDELLRAPTIAEWFPAEPNDLAYLQFSSGSTGSPKGVELTHGNVCANLGQLVAGASTTPDDVLVTWLPYFHDM